MTAVLLRRKSRWSSKTAYVVSSVIFALLAVQTLVVPFLYHHIVDQHHTTVVQPFSSDTRSESRNTISGQESSHRHDGSYSSQRKQHVMEVRRSQRSVTLANDGETARSSSSTASYTNRSRGQGASIGTFNGYPIYYVDLQSSTSNRTSTRTEHSTVHCASDNFQHDTAWIYRSCQFRRLCFDTNENDFVIFRSPHDVKVQEALAKYKDGPPPASSSMFGRFSSLFTSTAVKDHTSTSLDESVALGGLNPKWTWDGMNRMKWFPKVVITDEIPEQYYELDPNVVWVPFHSFYAANPGHLVWDDFLPIYTLLRMFSLLDGYRPLLMRHVLEGEPLWSTCDMDDKKKEMCQEMLGKFLPLFGLSLGQFSTNHDYRLTLTANGKQKSNLICSRQGAAGLGVLTDHGTKTHGVQQSDYEVMHNYGRGGALLDFRNFMMSNLQLQNPSGIQRRPPYIVTFALGSSQKKERHFSFTKQLRAVEDTFGSLVDVRTIHISKERLADQVNIASESAIYITACGGGAVTATFLSKGASLILFYTEQGGIGMPARLDWDILNNMAWIRSHWLPAKTMDDEVGVFVDLLKQEFASMPSFLDR